MNKLDIYNDNDIVINYINNNIINKFNNYKLQNTLSLEMYYFYKTYVINNQLQNNYKEYLKISDSLVKLKFTKNEYIIYNIYIHAFLKFIKDNFDKKVFQENENIFNNNDKYDYIEEIKYNPLTKRFEFIEKEDFKNMTIEELEEFNKEFEFKK